jgi:hypothetical protein
MKTTRHPISLALAAALIGAAILSAPQAQAGHGHDRAYIAAGALIGGVLGYLASDRDDHRGRVTVQVGHPRPRPVIVHHPRPRPVIVQHLRPPVVVRPSAVCRPSHGTRPSHYRPYYRHGRYDRRPVYRYPQKHHSNPHRYGNGHDRHGGYSNDRHGRNGGHSDDTHGKGHGSSKRKGRR